MLPAVVLATIYRGCDLLGELAENMNAGTDNEAIDGKKNETVELQKSSLRRSLSLVSLSELVTSLTTHDSDSDVSENQATATHCAVIVARQISPSGKEQCPVATGGHKEHSLDVSNNDCSFTEIPPLSQRLQMNYLHSDFTITDSVSDRGLAAEDLPLSGSTAESGGDKLENGCLDWSSQRTVNTDSAVLPGRRRRALPSRRRHALKLRTAGILSDDDVFLDVAKLSSAETKQHKAYSSDSTEIQKVISQDYSGSSTNDAHVSQCDTLNTKHKESVIESEIVQKFQSSLNIVDKTEDLESVDTNESYPPEERQVIESSDEYIAADAAAKADDVGSCINRLLGELKDISCQQFTGPVVWSPRHCGNFCIDTSIINTPTVDCSDICENNLQVHNLSLCDVDTLNNGNRTSFGEINTVNDESACTDEVVSDGYANNMSCLLFDDPVSPEEEYCNISVTENCDSHCDEGDYSVTIID